jgi:hypothetical protein
MFRINTLSQSSGQKNTSSAMSSFVTLRNMSLTFNDSRTFIAVNIISNTTTDYHTFTFVHPMLLSVGDIVAPRYCGILVYGRTRGPDYRGIWTTEGKLRGIVNTKQNRQYRCNVQRYYKEFLKFIKSISFEELNAEST